MKLLTNIAREHLGGITTTNNSLLSFLAGQKCPVVGLEFETARSMKGPIAMDGADPELFEHYIVNIHDFPLDSIIAASANIEEIKNNFQPVIEEIGRLIETTRPDVVLINGTSYFPWLIAIAAKKAGLPIILRYHGVSSKEKSNLPEEMRNKFLKIEKSFIDLADTFIFPSRLCQEAVEKEVFDKKLSNAYVIPNPVQAPPAGDQELPHRKIGAVGRLFWIKNIEAFFRLHEILTEQSWEHSASLVTEANDMKNLPPTIEYFVPMENKKIFDFYQSQGIIIAPSHFETFGNVPMEAVCMGVPVLVSDQMGCAEILIAAGLGNMVIDFSDLEAAASRVKELCGQKVPAEAVEKIRKMLDPDMINGRIHKILQQVLNK
ncbi:MAG: glycosyltransferase family 4 protein [Candidatus Buchananbacteria bacterium]|jgi:glycosyltransferase involved in cell wall biosynthesis